MSQREIDTQLLDDFLMFLESEDIVLAKYDDGEDTEDEPFDDLIEINRSNDEIISLYLAAVLRRLSDSS